jgi:hypothetical protein
MVAGNPADCPIRDTRCRIKNILHPGTRSPRIFPVFSGRRQPFYFFSIAWKTLPESLWRPHVQDMLTPPFKGELHEKSFIQEYQLVKK